jgi:uncharacterized protein YbcI
VSDLPERAVEQMQHAISDELLRIHGDSYGHGAATARTYILDDVVVCFLDDLELAPNEEFMIEKGLEETVLRMRNQFQQAIGPTYRAAVERATGRTVTSFVSDTKLDPNYAVEIFRLEPR